ncbi:uncharacterized protein LOC126982625 isoform X1 [Eriocheir sinensis]|uniref:uncharacterized protein LOC126982625 isoform X1 n=1 Tax=Eriocheir sinensis TaxID=95602 RepID=UPI0021CA5FEA|nr:uncharacterized protein LOC126982625 isoform X1 [Eriocheir sinensis]
MRTLSASSPTSRHSTKKNKVDGWLTLFNLLGRRKLSAPGLCASDVPNPLKLCLLTTLNTSHLLITSPTSPSLMLCTSALSSHVQPPPPSLPVTLNLVWEGREASQDSGIKVHSPPQSIRSGSLVYRGTAKVLVKDSSHLVSPSIQVVS